MNAETIRCQNDLNLAEILMSVPQVSHVRKQIERMEDQGPMGIRRHLLSSSVRLSRQMSPVLHDMADHCINALGVKLPLELYVYSSPKFNAACFKPEEGRLYVMFSSSLLEAFKDAELMFVMGHEFGHHVYNHHDIPIGYLLRGKQKIAPSLALQLFAWSRYAEISADRAGAFCANNFEGVARSLFKLASGLADDSVVQFKLAEFLKQLDEMQAVDAEPGRGAPMQDWFSTHPFSPLRVRALQLFHQSGLMVEGGIGRDQLEMKVQGIMGAMEPDYMEGRTDQAKVMRLLFIAGAIAVANARNGISEREKEVLHEFLGYQVDIDEINLDKLIDTLPKRIAAVREKASITQSLQVLRDLALVAKAENSASDDELIVLYQIADGLGVSRSIITQTLDASVELD